MDKNELPSIDEVIRAPWTRNWLKSALIDAIKRDPVDAANDADFLAALLNKRAEEIRHGV